MSQPRFAAITAGLLARKGEARPWAEPEKQPLAWRSAEASLRRRNGTGSRAANCTATHAAGTAAGAATLLANRTDASAAGTNCRNPMLSQASRHGLNRAPSGRNMFCASRITITKGWAFWP